ISRISVMPFDFPLNLQAMTLEKLQFALPAVFTIGPDNELDALKKYALLLSGTTEGDEQLQPKVHVPARRNHVQDIVKGIIEGETRVIVSSMTMEEIFKERQIFKAKVIENVQNELQQFGLRIYNANVKELQDTPGSEYFAFLSRKAHEGASNQAKIDVAEARMRGEIGEAEKKGRTKQEISKIDAETAVLETKRKAEKAKADSELTNRQTELERDIKLAKITAQRQTEMRDAELQKSVESARAETELERLRASDVTKSKIARESAEQRADASFYTEQKSADAAFYRQKIDSDAAYYRQKREAEGIMEMAKAYREMVDTLGGPQGFLQFRMIETGIYEKLAKANATAFQLSKIDSEYYQRPNECPHWLSITQIDYFIMAREQNGVRANWKCLAACTLVSMSPFQYGVDFTLIGGFQAMVGFLQLWNGPIATYIGRKSALWVACCLIYIANIIMMTTESIGALYAGRFIIGLGNGLLLTFGQLYIQEISPARYRGVMISIFQCWTSFGSLIGTIVDNFTAKIIGKNSYIIPLGIIYVIPVILCFGMFLIPESPRWLLQQHKREQAHKALMWLRPSTEIVEAEMADIQAALDMEQNLAASASIWDMFTNPVDRRRTILAVCGVTLQAATGAMYMIAYGTYFFEMAQVGSPFENSCILTALGVVAIMINSSVVAKIGRRRQFLMTGMTLCGISQLITAVIYTVQPGLPSTGKAIVGLAVIFIVGYNGMVSSYAWVSGGELPSQRLRSYTFGLAAAIGFLGAWLTTFTAPYFINPDALNWGPKYGFIWFPSCLIGAVWVFFFLPEVKNRTLEEIDEMFEMGIPARKFSAYKCVGRAALAAIEQKNTGGGDGDDAVNAEKKGTTAEEVENVD
ncbi:uncharacterized protein TRUGW13939_06199, partial [Talaromyces rugulosus]